MDPLLTGLVTAAVHFTVWYCVIPADATMTVNDRPMPARLVVSLFMSISSALIAFAVGSFGYFL